MLRRQPPMTKLQTFGKKARSSLWFAGLLARHGWPRTIFHFGRAPGDDLLFTVALRELRRRGRRGIWMLTENPDLLEGNPDAEAVEFDSRICYVAERTGLNFTRLKYSQRDPLTDADA